MTMKLYDHDEVVWAAQNVQRQRRGPMQVVDMLRAMYFARERASNPAEPHPSIRPGLILLLGHLVEPTYNESSRFRSVNVTIGTDTGASYDEVERLITGLCEAQESIEVDEFYYHFERIHPFADGNGRVGAILWNILRWKHDHQPVGTWAHPPDYYSTNNWFELGKRRWGP